MAAKPPGPIRLPRKRRVRMLAATLRALLGRPRVTTRPALHVANLPRLDGPLEIVRDARGVPHVYAERERDLYRALGYLQAADRFLLLDLVRHLGAGRICELAGDFAAPVGDEIFAGRSVADLDRFVRPLDFEAESERDFARIGARGRACLEGFAEGVNAALRALRGVYPAEYLLLGRVRPWRPEDCLLTARTSGFVVSLVNFENELTFDAVRAQAGDELARRLYPEAPWKNAPTSYAARGAAPPEPPVHVPSAGSNNWAVASSRSASGAPLFANDPHVPIVPLPTYWYHAHLELRSGERGDEPGAYRVQGGVFPGCPVFGFGHNGELAWGCTTGFRDGWDFYRIHRIPGNPTLYRTPQGVAPIRRHRESLDVRWGGPRTLEWESCEHGVIYEGWEHHDGTDLAVRFVPANGARYVEGYLALAGAPSVEAHRAALEQIHDGAFDFNHVYAHRDGHIGWELFGRLPRRRSDGLFVRDAHDPAAQWDGFVPFEEMPRILNPPSGRVASANSTVDPEDHERVASLVHFEPRYRQERIERVLDAQATHTAESFQALQSDVQADYAPPLRDALVELLASRKPGAAAAALRHLSAWECDFRADSVGASLYFFTLQALLEGCFVPLLGARTGRRFVMGRRGLPRLQRMLVDPADPLRADVERASGRALAELAGEAFEAAIARLERMCGAEPEEWRWGRIQRARLGTLLAEIPWLGERFLALDEPFPGDDYTVSPSRSLDEGHRLRAFVGASSRFVCDLARPEEAWFAHSSGPSGDVGSAFYANLSAPWQRSEYFRSALWAPDQVPDPVERLTTHPKA